MTGSKQDFKMLMGIIGGQSQSQLSEKNSVPTNIVGSSLPRSIRWRLQLGVFDMPSSPMMLFKENKEKLELQRETYAELVRKHEATYVTGLKELETIKPVEMHHDTISEDPLTFALKEQELTALNMHLYLIKRGSCMKSKLLRRADQLMVDDPEHMPHLEELEQIQKDLEGLGEEHFVAYQKVKNDEREASGEDLMDLDEVMSERNEQLQRLLHVCIMEHGYYKTGMHIIASHLLFCIEMDLAYTKPYWKQFLERGYLLDDTYSIFIKVVEGMESKKECIDVPAMLEHVSRDSTSEKLLHYIVQPAQIRSHEEIFIKWTSSLFATQINGWRNVFQFWDIVFDLVTVCASVSSMEESRYTRPGAPSKIRLGELDLVEIGRLACASLIWLNRKSCIAKGACFGVLVNVAPLESVTGLMATLLASARRYQIARDDTDKIAEEITKQSSGKGTASSSSLSGQENPFSPGSPQRPTLMALKTHESGLISRYRMDYHRETSMEKMINIGATSMTDLISEDVNSSDEDDEVPLNDQDGGILTDDSSEAMRLNLRPGRRPSGARRRRSSNILRAMWGSNNDMEDEIPAIGDDSTGSLQLDFPHAKQEKRQKKVENLKEGFRNFTKHFTWDNNNEDDPSRDGEIDEPLNDQSRHRSRRASGRFTRLRKVFSKDYESDNRSSRGGDIDEDAETVDLPGGDNDATSVARRKSSLVSFVTRRRSSIDTDVDALAEWIGDQELMDMRNEDSDA